VKQARSHFVRAHTSETSATFAAVNVRLACGDFAQPVFPLYFQRAAGVGGTLGKGEVESSILSRGTTANAKKINGFCWRYPLRRAANLLQNLPELVGNAQRLPWKRRGVRSPRVAPLFRTLSTVRRKRAWE
jgi:hypothetical protein